MNRAENPIRVPRKVALALVGSLILPIAACNNDEGATTTTTLPPENPIVIQNETIIDQQSTIIGLLGNIQTVLESQESEVEPDLPLAGEEKPNLPPDESDQNSTETPEAGADLEQPYANSADNENGVFKLMDSDNVVNEIDFSDVIGFTPDADLRISEISPNELDPIPTDAADFQAYLNTARDGFGPLAGFTDGTNDYNQYYNNESAPQLPAYGWMVHTGLFVEIPGVGRVEGGDSRAAVVIILNRTDDVYRWDTNSVKVIAGFQGWGALFNGEADAVQEAEVRLTNHYRERLGKGVPETGFIGQCDEGAENCDSVTVVTVERVQWGENEDGTPRYQFRLIRAETIPTSSN